MFSGKTEELMRQVHRARLAELGVQVFYPDTDTRVRSGEIESHGGHRLGDLGPTPMRAHPKEDFACRVRPNVQVVGIDEAQFFGDQLPDVVESLVARGLFVFAAGLDMDYLGRPFGSMPQLLARADRVHKLTAVCMSCKTADATRTHRKVAVEGQIHVGAGESYAPMCTACWFDHSKR